MLKDLFLLYRKTLRDYMERYKYRTYMSLSEKTKTESYDLFRGEEMPRTYVKEDTIFVLFPAFLLLFSVLSMIGLVVSKALSISFTYVALGVLIVAGITSIIMFMRGMKVNKTAIMMDTIATVGLLEIIILVICYIPFLLFSLFN